MEDKSIKTEKFDVEEFCHHRHEPHVIRIAYNGAYRCDRCGLYFGGNPKDVEVHTGSKEIK